MNEFGTAGKMSRVETCAGQSPDRASAPIPSAVINRGLVALRQNQHLL
jgi:hypothetical protein